MTATTLAGTLAIKLTRITIAPLVALLALAVAATCAHAQTYTNNQPIDMTQNSGLGVPYPSTIGVTGGPTFITAVRVQFRMINGDIAGPSLLLVAPTGQRVVLWNVPSTGGGSGGGFDFTVNLYDGGPTPPQQEPNAPPSSISLGLFDGTYAFSPTNLRNDFPWPTLLPNPTPSNFLSSLSGSNANGTWSLHAINANWAGSPSLNQLRGTIPSWSISFNETLPVWQAPPVSRRFSYQGRLTGPGGAPVNVNSDVRIALWKNETATDTGALALAQQVFNGLQVRDGLVNLTLWAPAAAFNNAELFAEVEVRSPAGIGAFTKLTPRQRITAAPSAQYAVKAGLADNATNAINAVTATSVPWNGVTSVPDNVANPFSPWFAAPNGIAYSGRVGINTSTPAAPLHVRGAFGSLISPNVSSSLVLDSLNGSYLSFISANNENGILFGGRTNSAEDAGIIYNNNALGGFQFRTGGNVTRLTITNTGSVGIGTTSPDQTLSVNGNASKSGGGSWASFSDQRLKDDINPLAGTLDRLLTLHGVSFHYKDPAAINELTGTQIGLLAQEVERVFPQWVQTAGNGYKQVTYRGWEALTIEALRDLRAEKDRQIDTLKSDAANRDAESIIKQREVDDLKARLAAIEAALSKLTNTK